MDRNWERNLRGAMDDGLKGVVQDLQRTVDSVHRQYAGKPVSTVKPALKSAWARTGNTLSEPDLTEWAQTISDGKQIELRL